MKKNRQDKNKNKSCSKMHGWQKKNKKNENLNVSSWAQVHKVGAGPTTTTIQAKNTFKQKNMNIQKKMESAHAILRKSDFGEFYSS